RADRRSPGPRATHVAISRWGGGAALPDELSRRGASLDPHEHPGRALDRARLRDHRSLALGRPAPRAPGYVALRAAAATGADHAGTHRRAAVPALVSARDPARRPPVWCWQRVSRHRRDPGDPAPGGGAPAARDILFLLHAGTVV